MFTKSLWNACAHINDFPSLAGDLHVDVAIIGGGITGISTAIELQEKGLRVAVLEALKIGGGSTSHSTGNLYYTTDKNLDELRSKYDTETVKNIVAARSAALNRISAHVKNYRLDCDFVRVPWYLYAADESQTKLIEKELEAGLEASTGIKEADPAHIPFKSFKAAVVNDQAQLNPMRYVQQLAAAVQSENLIIHECTRVTKVENDGGLQILHTDNASKVFAKFVVQATHTPKGIKFVHTLLGPYREYGIACRISDQKFPQGIFWGYYNNGEKISTRLYERGNDKFLIVVGKPHKVGQQHDNESRIRELEEFARTNFSIEEVSYRWGGQHYRPADLLPYIGKDPAEENNFIATGFSTDGLVYGTLSGIIIADLINGNTNQWSELFDPERRQPLKAAKNFLKENLNVVAQFGKNLPGVGEADDYKDIPAGEGKIIDRKGQKIAAFKTESGDLHICSAVCTHMACIVNWNNAEKSWDCPCHGSRFKPDGTVLEGPAFEPLKQLSEIKKM